ncbi:TAXI family TRAP transporter solute-binding subunit [Desulfoferula mesophila]|uniref:C4-dicarboxylate ABC transporter substrate-binding protein n=1 Tax=Desulfoferula mesophila TaxID=3058419 RepID=A0AAU9ELJ3_9BACT|nr:C4-dicarboxylate ABC transporter substrate-binding protein [Desulfoferula mesophilus]
MKQLRILGVAVLMATMALVWSGAAWAQTNLSLITAPFGTGSYVLGSALEQITKKYSKNLQITSSESPGLVFNCRKLNKEPELKKSMFMSFTVGINWLATEGKKPFKKKYPSALLLANYNLISCWLVTLDPKIKTHQDLVGKKIALGRAPQISWTIEPEMIIRYGWGLADKIDIQKVGTKPAVRALLDGLVDAAIIGGYADPVSGTMSPSPQTVELLASGKTLYHIPWGKEAVQKVIDRGLPIAHYTIAPKAVAGLNQPMDSFCDMVSWQAYPELPEKAAYETVKLIIDHVGDFKDYHALGKLMSRKSLAYGWDPKRIHPGALKAYREAGIIK